VLDFGGSAAPRVAPLGGWGFRGTKAVGGLASAAVGVGVPNGRRWRIALKAPANCSLDGAHDPSAIDECASMLCPELVGRDGLAEREGLQ
jgi:hypothetical protein